MNRTQKQLEDVAHRRSESLNFNSHLIAEQQFNHESKHWVDHTSNGICGQPKHTHSLTHTIVTIYVPNAKMYIVHWGLCANEEEKRENRLQTCISLY